MSLLLKSEAYLNNKMDELDELIILKLILKWMLWQPPCMAAAALTAAYGARAVLWRHASRCGGQLQRDGAKQTRALGCLFVCWGEASPSATAGQTIPVMHLPQ